MDPTTLIPAIVSYFAKQIQDNKAVKDFTSDFGTATMEWIRPIFLKDDDQPTKTLQTLQADPGNEKNLIKVEGAIENALDENPDAGKAPSKKSTKK